MESSDTKVDTSRKEPSSRPSKSESSENKRTDIDNNVRNQLNKLVDTLTDNIRNLRKSYNSVREYLDTFEKMTSVSYMDKMEPKRTVYAIYDKFFSEFKYDQLALKYTTDEVAAFCDEIDEILYDEDDDAEESGSESDGSRRRRESPPSDDRRKR